MTAFTDAAIPLTRPQVPYPLVFEEPDGEVCPPFLLIEGPEKVGKSWEVAASTADERICHTWWIEWGEKPCAREYGAITGARYEIVKHDGSFWAVLSIVEQLTERARAMITHNAAPMLVIDTGAGEWRALKGLAQALTMASPSVRRKIAANPAARGEKHTIPQNVWNDVIDLHYELIRLLQDFPGIVVIISRGKEVAAVDTDGNPTGERAYRVEGHKELAYDVSAWVRMSREGKPLVIGSRSTRAPLKPGKDRPREYKGLGWLVFEVLKFEPKPWQEETPPVGYGEVIRQHQLAGPVSSRTSPRTPAATPKPMPIDWDAHRATAYAARDDQALRDMWKAAGAAGAGKDVLHAISRDRLKIRLRTMATAAGEEVTWWDLCDKGSPGYDQLVVDASMVGDGIDVAELMAELDLEDEAARDSRADSEEPQP